MIMRERYMQQIRDFMDKPVVKVLTGMRRSGKSALLELTQEELLSRGVSRQNIIFMNFESLRYESLKNYKALYEEITARVEQTEGRVYLLLDEIQEVTSWEQAVNSFRVDFDCDIYVTGSNAKLLSGELATLLAGRYVEIRVYPLDFKEYLLFAATNEEESQLPQQEQFANFLRFGGLPGIHQMKWDEDRIMQYLQDIYRSVLLKDVMMRNQIRDTALLERIILYLMDNIGNTFSAKTISAFLKSQGRKLSTETVYNYLDVLESAFLIHKVTRFDIKGKRLLETQEKYYFSDLGLRHAVMGYRDNDIAGILENVVFLELLRRGYSVHIGKQDAAEVDFIADRADER
ncbi:MAG: ATP-binding protein, partial [Bacillota bacterium]|nr:ATP-binding protein [Bacillota bacterium]